MYRSSHIYWGLFGCIALLGGTKISAQAIEGAAQGELEGAYVFKIVYFDYGIDKTGPTIVNGKNIFFFDQGEEFRLAARHRAPSNAFNYRGPASLPLYQESVNTEGERILLPFTQLKLGQPGKKIIFLARGTNGQFFSTVTESGMPDFKLDHIRVFNFSRQEVKVKIDAQGASLQPMQSHDFPTQGAYRQFLVQLSMAVVQPTGLKLIEHRRYAMQQGERKLIIVHPKVSNPKNLNYVSMTVEDTPRFANQSDEELVPIDVSEPDFSEGY